VNKKLRHAKNILFFILIISFQISGCAVKYKHNPATGSWVSRKIVTKGIDAYRVDPIPNTDVFWLCVVNFTWMERRISWPVIVFDKDLRNILYKGFSFDADGDGIVEVPIPVEFENKRAILVSGDMLCYFNHEKELIPMDKNENRLDLTEEYIRKNAVIINRKNCLLLKKGSDNYNLLKAKWNQGRKNNAIEKILTPKQIKVLKRRDYSPIHRIGNFCSNATAIWGLWEPVLWAKNWFRWMRTGFEANFAAQGLNRAINTAPYGTGILSNYGGRDVIQSFKNLEERRKADPGIFYKLYLKR